MKVKYFEDLEIWKIARHLNNMIYELLKEKNFSFDNSLKDQIRRASISIMSNIAEGFERGGNQEFQQFLYIAKASCAEVRCQLYIAFDQGYIDKIKFENLNNLTKKLSIMIANFIKYLKGSKMKGEKFKPAKIKSMKEEWEEFLNEYKKKNE